MSIWSKVFIVMIMLAGLGFFYTAARTLKTHEAWRTKYNQHVAELARVQADNEKVVDGDPAQGQPSLNGLKAQIADIVAGRGRVWYNVGAGQVDGNTGAVTVTVDHPDPHGINPGMVVYAIDDLDLAAGGRYLGEFKVTEAAAGSQDVKLEPTQPPLDREKAKLTSATAHQWTLYETMPLDRRDVFATLSDDQIRALMPPDPVQEAGETPAQFQQRVEAHRALVEDFLRDGDEPRPGDPEDRIALVVQFTKQDQSAINALAQLRIPDEQKISPNVLQTGEAYEFEKVIADQLIAAEIAREVGRKYRRPLRDFSLIIREHKRQLPILLDRVASAEKDDQYMKDALADARRHAEFNEAEIAELKTEGERLRKEAELAVAREASLDAELKMTEAAVKKTLAANKKLATQLASQQADAAKKAEEAIQYEQASVER
jgi:hypothetical protein